MANLQIKNMPLKDKINGEEDVLIQDDGVTKRVKAKNLTGNNSGATIPEGGITKDMLDEELNIVVDKVQNLPFKSASFSVSFDIRGNEMNTGKVWSSGTMDVSVETGTDYKIITFSNTGTSNATYQISPKYLTNTGSGEMYARFVYEVLDVTTPDTPSTSIPRFLDAANATHFPKTIGEHKEVYKVTAATGSYGIKIEFQLAAGATFKIKLKRFTLVDFAGSDYDLDRVTNYFELYENDYSGALVFSPTLDDSSIPDGLISPRMLNDKLDDITRANKWKGKTYVSYGDSITISGVWQKYAVESLGLIHVNKGVGGTTLCGDETDTTCGFQDARIDSFPDSVDVISIMFGTNDWSRNKVIGNDDGDTTTYKGAMGVTIRKLQTKYPTARIIIIAPPFRTDSLWDAETPVEPTRGVGLIGFGDCCEEMAEKYGCSFINSYRDMGVNIYNFKHFLQEETWPVHLNALGGERLGVLLLSKLLEIAPLN